MRHLVAILFLFVFSLQVIPVKSIGKLLCKSQGTEEVQSDDVCNDDNSASNLNSVCYTDIIIPRHSFDPVALSQHFERKVSSIIRTAQVLPVAYVTSIPAPPPDQA